MDFVIILRNSVIVDVKAQSSKFLSFKFFVKCQWDCTKYV